MISPKLCLVEKLNSLSRVLVEMSINHQKESEIQKEILDWLSLKGHKVWKNYLGPKLIKGGYFAKNPNAGQPDIFGIYNDKSGKLFAIEVKTEIGRLSEGQKNEIRELEKFGVFVVIARDLKTVIEAFGG